MAQHTNTPQAIASEIETAFAICETHNRNLDATPDELLYADDVHYPVPAGYVGTVRDILASLCAAGALDAWGEMNAGERIPANSPALALHGVTRLISVRYCSRFLLVACATCGEVAAHAVHAPHCLTCEASARRMPPLAPITDAAYLD